MTQVALHSLMIPVASGRLGQGHQAGHGHQRLAQLAACHAVFRAPLRSPASTVTVPQARAAMEPVADQEPHRGRMDAGRPFADPRPAAVVPRTGAVAGRIRVVDARPAPRSCVPAPASAPRWAAASMPVRSARDDRPGPLGQVSGGFAGDVRAVPVAARDPAIDAERRRPAAGPRLPHSHSTYGRAGRLIERTGPFGVPGADQPDAVAAGPRDARVVRRPGQPDPPRPSARSSAALLAGVSPRPGPVPGGMLHLETRRAPRRSRSRRAPARIARLGQWVSTARASFSSLSLTGEVASLIAAPRARPGAVRSRRWWGPAGRPGRRWSRRRG